MTYETASGAIPAPGFGIAYGWPWWTTLDYWGEEYGIAETDMALNECYEIADAMIAAREGK